MKNFYTLPLSVLMAISMLSLSAPTTAQAADNTNPPPTVEVSGKVTGENNQPVVGVTVVEKGTNKGTTTDGAGRYKIKAQPKGVLIFSCIGYDTREVSIGGKTKLDVKLAEGSLQIEETVVIGYGVSKKRDLTGSVSSIKSDEFMKTNPVSINQGLQGKMAGVMVSQSDGAPGAGISIQIRGANSFKTSTEPLYVVDGVPIAVGDAPANRYGSWQTSNPLSFLNPQDIQSIEVLKDASATAIYGSRAANGVILVTTKTGSGGVKPMTVQFSATMSVSNPVKLMDVLSPQSYAEYRNEMRRNGYLYDGQSPVEETGLPYPIPGQWRDVITKDPLTGQEVVVGQDYYPSPSDFTNGFMLKGQMFYGTNWQDEVFQTAFTKDYGITVSGGDEKGSYSYSGGYLDQQGIIVNSFYKRYNARANNTRKVNKFMEIGSNLNFSLSDNRFAATNTENYGLVTSAISFNPDRPVFDPGKDSGYSEDYSSGLINPYLTAHTEKNLLESTAINIGGFGTVSFTDYLQFKQTIGYGYNYNERSQYYNRYTGSGQSPTNGRAIKSDNAYENLTSESTISFNKTYGKHAINAVAGMTYEMFMWRNKEMSNETFPSDFTEDNDMNAGIKNMAIGSGKGRSQIHSFLGRVNYIYNDRYLFTFSYRRDGSSRFAPKNRWANFYSGAFAWRLSDEPFIKSLNFFDNLKLRASYGQTGNQGISAYQTKANFYATKYPIDGSFTSGMTESLFGSPAAPNLKWETTNQMDLGIDVSFFKQRVGFVVDYYRKKTVDLLQDMMTPLSSGFSTLAVNYGSLTNNGLEITGNFVPVVSSNRNFRWNLDVNMSFNRNTIGNLGADQFSNVAWGMESMFIRRNGYALGTIYGYREDGFYDNEAEVRADPKYTNESESLINSMVGQVKYLNMDDDPAIDARDKVIIGDTNPDFTYGITNTFTYKNWTLNVFLQGTRGNDIVNVNLRSLDLSGSNNIPQFIYDRRWTPENRANATWPRPDQSYTRKMQVSDRYVVDGSYLRCKNLSVSYRLNKPFKFVDAIDLSFGVTNLFTISDYEWFDPDVNSFGSDATRRGVDMASYPSARTFSFGIKINM